MRYPCGKCEYTAAYNSTLKRHTKSDHDVEDISAGIKIKTESELFSEDAKKESSDEEDPPIIKEEYTEEESSAKVIENSTLKHSLFNVVKEECEETQDSR